MGPSPEAQDFLEQVRKLHEAQHPGLNFAIVTIEPVAGGDGTWTETMAFGNASDLYLGGVCLLQQTVTAREAASCVCPTCDDRAGRARLALAAAGEKTSPVQ